MMRKGWGIDVEGWIRPHCRGVHSVANPEGLFLGREGNYYQLIIALFLLVILRLWDILLNTPPSDHPLGEFVVWVVAVGIKPVRIVVILRQHHLYCEFPLSARLVSRDAHPNPITITIVGLWPDFILNDKSITIALTLFAHLCSCWHGLISHIFYKVEPPLIPLCGDDFGV